MRGAIIVAGGTSRRLGRPKCFLRVGDEALLDRVARVASAVADDVVVSTRGALVSAIGSASPGLRVVRDRVRARTPLAGLLAGARASRTGYVAALACDLPFLRPVLLEALFRFAKGHDAAVPRWPDGKIEPLVAVYRRTSLLAATRGALAARERSNIEMVRRLGDVRYVDTHMLRPFDRRLSSFFNVNATADLVQARRLTESGARRRRR